jgi:aspartate aminotransferase
VALYFLQTAAAKLLFGSDSAAVSAKRVATCQTLSGTGALTVAAPLIKRTLPGRRIFCSDPTWENHGKVVADAGAGKLESYRYYDPKTCGLDIDGMLADLRAMPEGSIVLLHACAHNPTGAQGMRVPMGRLAALAAAVTRPHSCPSPVPLHTSRLRAGVDPTREQWESIADVMQERSLFPWFDVACECRAPPAAA